MSQEEESGNRLAVTAFIGLGANLGNARATVLGAIQALSTLPDSGLLRASSVYRTAPFEASGPDYFNAVVMLSTRLNALALLSLMQQMEAQQGRERPFKNAPRTLDLDLLLYGDARLDGPQLQVPHPRMMERAFVLYPMAEIAPERVSQDALNAVASQTIERLTEVLCPSHT